MNAAATARKRQPKAPLTDAQRDLAAEHWAYALEFGRTFRKQYQRRLGFRLPPELVESAVAVGLVDTARNFRPERGLQFRTLLVHRLRGAILDALRVHPDTGRQLRRDEWATAPRILSLDRPVAGHLGLDRPAHEFLVSRDRPCATEREDFEAMVRPVRQMGRAALRLIYLEGLSQVEAARELGIHQSRVSQIVAEALEHLRNTAERSRAC